MVSLDFLARKDILLLQKDAKIVDALDSMENSAYKTGVFLEDGKIVGIITESDFINAFLKGFSYSDNAYDIATKNVVYFHSNRSLEYAVDVLISKNLKRVPIIDANGEFVGLLTQDAVIEYFESKNDRLKQKAINLIAKNKVVCADINDSVKHCASLMSTYGIGFLPIFDAGKLVGSITDIDILSIIKHPDSFCEPVSNFMSCDVGIVDENASVESISSLMKQKNITQVVVSGCKGELIGVLSKRDLTRNIKDSYQHLLEKKLKSARDSLYTMPTPIIEIEKSYGGYYVVWHNAAAKTILGVELFDFKITDILTSDSFAKSLGAIDGGANTGSAEIDINDKSFTVSVAKIDDSVLQLVFHNITNIKKESEQIKKIIDILPEIILVTNGKKIMSSNKSLLDFFGVRNIEEFLLSYSCICENFLPHEGFLEFDGKDTWVKTALQNTSALVESLAKMFDRNRGEERIFSVKAIDLNSADGGILVSLFDITERHLQRELLENQTKELEKLATTDSLTGIYNRNKLKEIATYEFKKLKREKYPLSMLLFDIDHFKKINDTYGHNVGDYTLKTIASLVGGLIRESDTFVRWGGEEFIILAPSTSLQNAGILAEKIRASIEAYDFESVGRVTCSFGVAEAGSRLEFDGLVEHADKALYVAKKGGRNRVECF